VHLRCTKHIRRNSKDKLCDLNIPQYISNEFLADIFGCQIGTHFEAGLADAKSESLFIKGLQKVQAKWSNLEKSCNPSGTTPKFFEWFVQYKADEIKKCALLGNSEESWYWWFVLFYYK